MKIFRDREGGYVNFLQKFEISSGPSPEILYDRSLMLFAHILASIREHIRVDHKQGKYAYANMFVGFSVAFI